MPRAGVSYGGYVGDTLERHTVVAAVEAAVTVAGSGLAKSGQCV